MRLNDKTESRKDLVKLFIGNGAEIGVERGVFSKMICEQGKIIMLFSIDAWAAYKGYRDHVTQEKLDNFYVETKVRLMDFPCLVMRKFSLDAVKFFADESLDFIYIDANHDYENVKNDIIEWAKKVKKGGIVAGHDYIRNKGNKYINQTKDALHDYCKENNIDEITIWRGDRSPSWSFIKQ